MHQYLRQQDRPITARQVRQTVQESGWDQLRSQLKRQYHLTATDFQPREGWLVRQLLNQVETLLALQRYGWGYSTCRRTAQALDVRGMTVYFWVSAWGHQLLPVAALCGQAFERLLRDLKADG